MPTRAQMGAAEERPEGHTDLMYAALEGHTERVKALLRKGADVNAQDIEGRTALMFAVVNLHYETVQALLEHGADVNARAHDGGTALTLAATGGDARIVRALLDRGAEVEAESARPDTNALKLAVKYGHDEIVRLLKKAGAARRGKAKSAQRTRHAAGKKEGEQ